MRSAIESRDTSRLTKQTMGSEPPPVFLDTESYPPARPSLPDQEDTKLKTTNAPETPQIEKLRGLLNGRLRIKTTDERVLLGTFHCFDNLKNIVLSNTKEASVQDGSNFRHLGMVLIPWKWVVSCHAD